MGDFVHHSACGLAECDWIDCAEHQWGDGRACDAGWFAMRLGNLRARMFVQYATRAGADPEAAADYSQNVFFAQAFNGDESADAAVALAWAHLFSLSAPGGSA